METTTGRVLKKENFKIEGQMHINLAQPQPAAAKNINNKDIAAPADMPQACIVDSQPDFVIIEITCGCGTKTLLKCQYAQKQ